MKPEAPAIGGPLPKTCSTRISAEGTNSPNHLSCPLSFGNPRLRGNDKLLELLFTLDMFIPNMP